MKIIKRNGSEAVFDITKIIAAITKANKVVPDAQRLTKQQIIEISDHVQEVCYARGHAMNVEEIQDIVEDAIMATGAYEVARRYITYRYVQSLKRTHNTTDDKILSLIECNNEEVKQENSNKNPTVNSVQRDYMAGEISKDLTARLLLDPEIVKAHQEGLIHFHDSDYFAQHMHNCDLVNLEDMLQNGTVISGTYIEKPHSFSTACNIATQIIAQVASNQYGGQSISLAHLAPFVQISREKIKREFDAEVKELGCGDIGAIAKMDKVKTGDTLCEPRKVVKIEPIPFDEPCYSVAIAPKTRGQEDKMAQGLNRLNEEDPSFRVVNNAETHQMVVSGAGDIQIDVLVNKLKSRFGVEVVLDTPRVPYREKIRKTVSKQGRHKKQTGGHGQFGDVIINFEPCDSEQVVFEEKVFGGSVPKNFFPAVEKGVRLAAEKGVLAGYPVVGLKATLLDGSYHPVDSSEMAFIMAAKLAYKAAMPEAGPVILEPIHTLKAHVPNDNTGDIMGDVTKRRGRVLGMEPDEDGLQTIIAEVPLAELANFTTFIRQTTQGRGWFTTEFARYEVLPEMLVPAVVEQAKKLGNLDESADD